MGPEAHDTDESLELLLVLLVESSSEEDDEWSLLLLLLLELEELEESVFLSSIGVLTFAISMGLGVSNRLVLLELSVEEDELILPPSIIFLSLS